MIEAEDEDPLPCCPACGHCRLRILEDGTTAECELCPWTGDVDDCYGFPTDWPVR